MKSLPGSRFWSRLCSRLKEAASVISHKEPVGNVTIQNSSLICLDFAALREVKR